MYKVKTILLLFFCFLMTGCALFSEDYTPASFELSGDEVIMTGVIDGSTPDEVRDLIENHPAVKKIVMTDVPGSADDEANLEAARLIREHGFRTHVPADGEIASGGVDFFLAGVERTAVSGAKLGVHSWAAGDGVTGDELPRNDPEHQLYLNYYEEMGIPTDFYWFTLQAAPAEDIYFMTPEEWEQYELMTN